MKCPHCRTRQLTNLPIIIALATIGIVLLPITWITFPVAWSFGLPNGFIEGFVLGIAWGIVLVGPILLLIALGGYGKRREALNKA